MNNESTIKILLNSLEVGIILTGSENKVIFINDFLKKYLDNYSYENQDLKDLFEIFDEGKIIDSNLICGYSEAQTSGIIFEKEPLILVTKNNQTKIVSLKSFKNKRLFENNITSLIQIKDIEEKAELEKMKTDFSSQTVHILRTPISIIRNNLDSLSRSEGFKNLSEKEKRNLDEIKYGTQQLLELAQNLITINEIENEKIELNTTDSYLIQVIETAVKEMEEVKIKTGNKITFSTPIYEIPKLKLDTLKIVSVIKGVLMNSLNHTRNGEIIITLSKDSKNVILTIEDNGEGISETALRFIFNKFYHSKKNALVMEQGLGIGLYSSKKVIEAHLGEMFISSVKDKGTKVTIKFKI
jgi:signal transduction histidine kinase